MSLANKIDSIVERVIERKIEEYFGSLLELRKGPIFQVHASMTKAGLGRAVRKTKRSQLADLRVNEPVFFKAPKGVDVKIWESRWCSARTQMQRKTGYVWRVNRDYEQGGVCVTRTR